MNRFHLILACLLSLGTPAALSAQEVKVNIPGQPGAPAPAAPAAPTGKTPLIAPTPAPSFTEPQILETFGWFVGQRFGLAQLEFSKEQTDAIVKGLVAAAAGKDTVEHHHPLAHQFDNLDQQHEASTLGMWIFLSTEIMFFGGLFTGYTIYRAVYPEAWGAASREMSILIGALNTAVLITSSLSMALAIHAAQIGKRKRALAMLVVTMLLGLLFLGFKGIEYHEHWTKHQFPGYSFQFDGKYEGQPVDPRKAELFFSFYWVMTGMHAAHMIIGIGIVAFISYGLWRGRYLLAASNPVEMTGLYWHFVDIIWIFLFPLLYLVNLHH